MRNLIERVPKYYRRSNVMALMLGTDAAFLDSVERVLDETDAQCLIATATDELTRWEKIFGVPTSMQDIERRRERLLAKKRGSGTGTIEHLKRVISSFSNGDVEIAEIFDQYLIEISFVGTYGIPPYMDDVRAAIDEIIPAHIAYTIVIRYHVWDDYAAITWEEAAGMTWDEAKEANLNAG